MYKRQPLNNIKLWETKKYSFISEYNQDTINEFIEAKTKSKQTPSQNAVISIENGKVVIVPEENQVDVVYDDPYNNIINSIGSAKSITIEAEIKVTTPLINASKLEPLIDHIRQVMNTDIKLKLNGSLIQTSKEQRASWLTIDPNLTDTSAVKVDPIKTEGYIDCLLYTSPSPRDRS